MPIAPTEFKKVATKAQRKNENMASDILKLRVTDRGLRPLLKKRKKKG